MQNPIALLTRPSRGLLLCFGVVVLYGLFMLAAIDRAECCGDLEDCAATEISPVELLP